MCLVGHYLVITLCNFTFGELKRDIANFDGTTADAEGTVDAVAAVDAVGGVDFV